MRLSTGSHIVKQMVRVCGDSRDGEGCVLLLFSVDNVCEVLTLTVDGKNVSTGELTVFLDGLSFDLQHVHNGNPTTASSKSTCTTPNLTSDL